MYLMRSALTLLFLASVAMAQNLVQNPGFETGSFAPWVAKGWDVNNGAAHTGTFYAETGCVGAACITPDPSSNGAWLYQDIPTTPGAKYTLTFFYFPGVCETCATDKAELQVLWGPSGTHLTTGGAGSCTGNCVLDNTSIGPTTYTQYTVTNLTATSASTRLEFLGRQDPAADGVDDVVVTLTPASTPAGVPALTTRGMAALALVLLVFAGRRMASVGRPA